MIVSGINLNLSPLPTPQSFQKQIFNQISGKLTAIYRATHLATLSHSNL